MLASAPLVNKAAVNQPLAKPLPQAQPVATSKLTASPIPATTAFDLDQVVREASNRNRLDPDFVSSVISAESNFKVHAISKKGALGLMQLMPSTAAQLGVADPFDPRANVEAGTAHLSALLDRYNNDTSKALSKQAADKLAELGKLSGAAFDKAYVANEVAYHKTVDGALETQLIPSASNSELKSLLQTGLKIFQGHEQHAEHVAASLK